MLWRGDMARKEKKRMFVMNSAINNCNTQCWKADIRKSVLFYNDWFLNFAPKTYIGARNSAIDMVERAFQQTDYFRNITPATLEDSPAILSILRMATTPPLARDRLAGLADAPKALIKSLEEGKIPAKHKDAIGRVVDIVARLLDKDMMTWIGGQGKPRHDELLVAKAIIGDRVCGSLSDPLIRNAQERRQLEAISKFLDGHGYRQTRPSEIRDVKSMMPGTYAYRLNVPVLVGTRTKVNIPVDVVIKRRDPSHGELPVFVECKSAGDFTNTNKRRKEEAAKISQLRGRFGEEVKFILFLCGYFDSGYLGYEAAEGIDWVWEHRIADLEKIGV